LLLTDVVLFHAASFVITQTAKFLPFPAALESVAKKTFLPQIRTIQEESVFTFKSRYLAIGQLILR
jgi:hypothetical protein